MPKGRIGDDERRRAATQIGPAYRWTRGCGGRRPPPSLLLLDVPVPLYAFVVAPRRGHAWRAQRGSREVMEGALSTVRSAARGSRRDGR